MKIYFYKLTVDSGGAPCIHGGLLSLAICKPSIRATAKEGDLIFGLAASSLSRDNRLIYVAYVTTKLCEGEYYIDRRYFRRPDCIYQLSKSRFVWKNGSAYHGPMDLRHDLGKYPNYKRANVLLSKNFRYFGSAGTDEYKSKYPRVGRAVERLGQGSRVHHDEELRRELTEMADSIWRSTSRKVLGRPTNVPSGRICLRSRSCGVAL